MAVRAEQLPVTTVRLLPDRLDLVLILALALALRMLFILTTPINTAGGDTRWLLETGLQIVQNRVEQVPQTPPLYLLFNGLVQVVSGSASLEVIRVFNAIFGLITVALLYVIGCLYFNRRAGQMVAIAVAINPIFIIETGNILTESLFLPLFFGAIALYAFYTRGSYEHLWRGMALVGVLLGLATLTRAPTLALPAVFGLHLIVTFRWRGVRLALILGAAYLIMLSTWSVYTLVRWGTFVLAGQGIAANIFIGTTEGWCGPECTDQQVGITGEDGGANNQQKYLERAAETISADPIGYLLRRVSNVVEATLQPHNTVFYPGESLKNLAAAWWANDRSLSGLLAISAGDHFWPKALIYVFHFTALGLGIVGLLIATFRQRIFWEIFPLFGVIGYFYALHLVMTAIPRYLFPLAGIWWLLAAFMLTGFANRKAQLPTPEGEMR
ncbi:MAG: hypothetical protein OHK0023_15330 [Anaerolineae bacterium]